MLARLFERGYRRSDIAVLTQRNDDVVKVTAWLNAQAIPFVSYSSLDVRRRKITGEIVALLAFFDSPPDSLSFATFLLGDVMAAALKAHGGATGQALHEMAFRNRAGDRPLYKRFQDEMPALWDRFFDRLFRLAGYLPLYDLVVEVYRVFDVFARFPSEEAALSRILEVVKDLEAEGGGLRRFLDAALLSDAAEADWNVAIPGGVDAVKVMTVHKAKGLGFPVVILLFYTDKSRGFRYIVQESEGSIALLRLTKNMLGADEAFEERYRMEETKEKVAKLNSLYVAFTRAGAELYVIAVKYPNDKSLFPFGLLPEGTAVFAKAPPAPPERQERKETGGDERIEAVHPAARFEAPSGPEGPMRYASRRRGEIVHRIFSLIDYIDGDAAAKVGAAAGKVRKTEGADSVPQPLTEAISAFLSDAGAAAHFERRTGRRVMLEQELADARGRLFRADRVVIDADRITVMEFKTGREDDFEDHLAQMRNYLRLMSEIYKDKPVEGVIAYVDAKKMRRVGP